MSRNPSAPQLVVVAAALALLVAAIAWLPSDDPGQDGLDITAADASTVAAYNADGAPALAQDVEPAETKPLALPVAQNGTAAPAPEAIEAAPAESPAPADEVVATTEAPADPAPQDPAPQEPAPAAAEPASDPAPQPDPKPDNGNGGNDGKKDGGYISRAEQEGYDVHDFAEHTVALLGTQVMEPGQEREGGYERVSPTEIRAWSSITGQRPVIEQAIDDIKKRNPNATGEDLERKIAKRLTELNDWKNLNDDTQEDMMVLSGVHIDAMDKRQREDTINHLLHSPLPFGYVDEVLTQDTTVDLGYTHTLDKDWTEAEHLGNGVFQIWVISNNNNGSHTGHVLGSFKVQLTPETNLAQARDIGNKMVKNKNKNNKLYLSDAARRVLYGQTPRLDFSHLTDEERRSVYEGRGLKEPTPPPIDPLAPPGGEPEPDPEPTTPPTSEPDPEPTTPPTSEPDPEPTTPPTSEPDPDPSTPSVPEPRS